MIEYYLEQTLPNGKIVSVYYGDCLKKITDYFEYYCGLDESKKYSIIKRETIDTIVTQSSDNHQQLMSFD